MIDGSPPSDFNWSAALKTASRSAIFFSHGYLSAITIITVILSHLNLGLRLKIAMG